MPSLFLLLGFHLRPVPCSSGRIQTPSLLFLSGCCITAIAMSGSTAPKANYKFVPQTLEPVQIDKMTVNLYPVVNSTMKPPERAHAFQINKTALAAPGIDRRVMLDTLGAQLNLSAIDDGVLGDWTRHFQRAWCNFDNLTILSFHNDAGAQVNDTTAADSAVLLPVVDGPVADCRKKNIRFV
jgi:hypothetical protein